VDGEEFWLWNPEYKKWLWPGGGEPALVELWHGNPNKGSAFLAELVGNQYELRRADRMHYMESSTTAEGGRSQFVHNSKAVTRFTLEEMEKNKVAFVFGEAGGPRLYWTATAGEAGSGKVFLTFTTARRDACHFEIYRPMKFSSVGQVSFSTKIAVEFYQHHIDEEFMSQRDAFTSASSEAKFSQVEGSAELKGSGGSGLVKVSASAKATWNIVKDRKSSGADSSDVSSKTKKTFGDGYQILRVVTKQVSVDGATKTFEESAYVDTVSKRETVEQLNKRAYDHMLKTELNFGPYDTADAERFKKQTKEKPFNPAVFYTDTTISAGA